MGNDGVMDAEAALDRWEQDGLVDADLADRMRSRLVEYRTEAASATAPQRDVPSATSGPGAPGGIVEPWRVRFVVMLGAVLVGGGLLAFIAGQWDQQSPLRRMALLMLVWALITAAAVASTVRGLVMTGRAFWFMSTVAAGANIFLIGQVYNLPLNWWQGCALWMLCALVMGWASGSDAQGWLAVTMLVLTVGWLVPPNSRWAEQAAALVEPQGLRALMPVLGLALIVVSRIAQTRADPGAGGLGFLRQPAMVIGAVLVAVPLVVSAFHPDVFVALFSMEFGWRHAVFLLVAAVVIAVGAKIAPHPVVYGAAAAVGLAMIVILPQVAERPGSRRVEPIPWLGPIFRGHPLTFWVWNAVVLAAAIAVVLAGRHYGERALLNVGMVSVAVLVLAFYIGRIAGQLPTSLAMVGGGLVLVAGGYVLERRRRDLLDQVAP